MDLPTVCKTSLDLKRYLLTSVSNKRKYEASLSSYCHGAYLVPVSDAEYGRLNFDLDEDPLFLDYTLNVITPRFAKRRRLTLIKFYSSESVNPGDTHGCSTSSILDQYLTKIIPLVRNTNGERSVQAQSSPVSGVDLTGTKPPICMKMGAEQRISAWNETNNFYSDYSSISSGEDNSQRTVIRFSTVEGRESTPVPPPRTKRITKSSENSTKGKKRKNDDDKTPGEDARDKTRKSSYPIPPPRKKACRKSKDQIRASEDGDHQFLNNGIIFSEYICGSIKQYETPIKEKCTGIITTCVSNVNDCERLQSEKSTVYGSEPFLNSNSLQHYHSRHNVGTKRPVMGKSAIFISIDLMSFDVLAEINRKVHLKYGDRKRRRIKTNGILNSESGAKKTIMETSEVFRKIGPCRKFLAFKNFMFMKKEYNRIPCV